ncbi:hypothetical protein DSL72_002076 [Monilinia vaccinii-corymbosi]|uniref:Short-chain dehydrogenase/reductase ABA4 n=1 Tax=Monilinia vaccinii-corymbosi TaxID=61207 RepID=A0A8A3PBQ7_9HELO|nr:hypothetical protein DSL72_002076 [Monilinia vaccinii-corymbosi]
MSASKGHFEQGHQPPVSHQSSIPGKQTELPIEAINDQLPTDDGGYQPYLAAGKLKGKKALITGGDSGIGRAVAILYAMEGAESSIVYTPEEEEDAQETKKLVEAKGGKIHLFPADLKTHQACKSIAEKAKEAMGRINILVLNHGTQLVVEKIADLSEDQWVNTFNVNVHSFFFLSKYILPQMSRGDTIITCASVNPYVGRPDLLDYTSTKGAIVAFTRALSNQQIGNGIRVNSVCPGPIWTPLIPATMNEKCQKEFTSPMGRPGQPSECATCFVFLASADSSFISGQSLHPNGGVQVGS